MKFKFTNAIQLFSSAMLFSCFLPAMAAKNCYVNASSQNDNGNRPTVLPNRCDILDVVEQPQQFNRSGTSVNNRPYGQSKKSHHFFVGNDKVP